MPRFVQVEALQNVALCQTVRPDGQPKFHLIITSPRGRVSKVYVLPNEAAIGGILHLFKAVDPTSRLPPLYFQVNPDVNGNAPGKEFAHLLKAYPTGEFV